MYQYPKHVWKGDLEWIRERFEEGKIFNLEDMRATATRNGHEFVDKVDCIDLAEILEQSVYHNKYDIAKFLLEHGGSKLMKAQHEKLKGVLLYAKEKKMTELLLLHGATMEMKENNSTEIFIETLKHNKENVINLIEGGVDPNCKEKERGLSLLHIVASSNQVDLADTLIQKYKVDPMVENDSETPPLSSASRAGSFEMVKFLVEVHNADVNKKKDNLYTPLTFAARNGHIEIVKYLLSHGAEPNSYGLDGFSPLTASSFYGHVEIVRLLADHGANVEEPDKNGKTPLYRAIWSTNVEMIKFFVEEKKIKNINALSDGGFAPLSLAAYFGEVDLVRYLGNHNADVNIRGGEKKYTSLIWACHAGHLPTVKCLVEEFGVDPNVTGMDGYSPLIIASYFGFLDVVQYLLTHTTANIGASTSYGYNALIVAARNGFLDVVKYLVEEHHIDPMWRLQRNDEDGSALSVAAKQSRHNVVKYLLKREFFSSPLRKGWVY
eukprot:m.34827 g.34827  ORF g.34827 m.34827 type:complete len:493 (-) comp6561_c0_seq1:1374-2852(-)